MLPTATRVPGLSGSAGVHLLPLHNHFWLVAAEKGFILYGDTPENCPRLEGLQRGEKSCLQSDESRGMRIRGEFPFRQAGSGRLASCARASPGHPPWDVGGDAASQRWQYIPPALEPVAEGSPLAFQNQRGALQPLCELYSYFTIG